MGYRKVRFPTSLTALAEHGEPVGAAIFPGFSSAAAWADEPTSSARFSRLPLGIFRVDVIFCRYRRVVRIPAIADRDSD